jgi:hypothetical protein
MVVLQFAYWGTSLSLSLSLSIIQLALFLILSTFLEVDLIARSLADAFFAKTSAGDLHTLGFNEYSLLSLSVCVCVCVACLCTCVYLCVTED